MYESSTSALYAAAARSHTHTHTQIYTYDVNVFYIERDRIEIIALN